jgi:tRNA(Ile)-lysidine synthase
MALRHEFEVLMGKLGLSRGTPVLVAVSGGVDSMALSYLAQQFFGSHVYTATVDHRLREESGEEAQHVHQWMTSMKIDHSILPLDWTEEEKRHPTQIMTLARQKRYLKLAQYSRKYKIQHIMTGHHMNDQLETFLMRFHRGSGVDGWTCMKSLSEYPVMCIDAWLLSLKLIRPFLNIGKHQLMELCRMYQIPWLEDPTNSDVHYYRNAIRFDLATLKSSELNLEGFQIMIHHFQRYQRENLQKGKFQYYSDDNNSS